MNSGASDIYMRPYRKQLPEHIASLVDHVGRDRDSPGPYLDQIRQDRDLDDLVMGAGEFDVEEYFKDKIFPRFLQALLSVLTDFQWPPLCYSSYYWICL
jgi:hypothetical protein